EIERKIPVGVGGGGEHKLIPDSVGSRWRDSDLEARLERIREKHPKIPSHKVGGQLGTLGSGNHFIEVCLDERDHVWTVLHSGSRGIGNQLAQMHIMGAKKLMKQQS